MYGYSISKVVDEDINLKEIERRIGKIALELNIGAFTLTLNRIGWEANGKIQMHDAFNLAWNQNKPHIEIRVICYAINKAFKGAQACFNGQELMFAGHTKMDKE